MRQGATIDFSGGGFHYAAGTANATVLVSGNKVYDIGTAPTNIRYDKIVSTQTVTHARYNNETYQGIYVGGGNPLGTALPAYTEGSNAGSLTIGARQAVLDGTISGSVVKGMYQYLPADPTTNGSQTKSGYVEPMGGAFYLGNASNAAGSDNMDRYLGNIIVTGNAYRSSFEFHAHKQLKPDPGAGQDGPFFQYVEQRRTQQNIPCRKRDYQD